MSCVFAHSDSGLQIQIAYGLRYKARSVYEDLHVVVDVSEGVGAGTQCWHWGNRYRAHLSKQEEVKIAAEREELKRSCVSWCHNL